MIRSRRLASALLVAYGLVVAFIVFLPTAAVASGSVSHIWSVLHFLGAPAFITPSVVEFVTNILLFMPLTFLGSTLKPDWGWKNWLLLGLATTCFIELTQLLFLPARSAQLKDVVSNTLGALAGYGAVLIGGRVRRVFSPSADQQA